MHSRLKAETAQREKAEQQKKQAVAIRKKKILLFSIIACLIVTAFVITTIVSGTNQRNNTFDDIEEFIANKQYEHAFDLVIASNLSQELKEQYIKNIKPQMQAQFEGEMEPQQVLNIDGFAIYTSRTTVYYLNESGDRVQLYKGSLIRGI